MRSCRCHSRLESEWWWLHRRNFADEVHQLGHLRRDAYDAVVSPIRGVLHCASLDFGAQLVASSAFLMVMCSSSKSRACPRSRRRRVERGFDVVELGIGGDHDDGAGVSTFLECIQNLDAAEVRHAHVEQDEVGVSCARA